MKKLLLFLFCTITINCMAQTSIMNAIYTSPQTDSLPSFTDDPYYFNEFVVRNFKVNSLMKSQPYYTYGTLTINFQIDTFGNISDINSFSSENVYIEKEIIRIISIMPNWKPAINDGVFVTTRVYIPISYKIKDNFFEIEATSSKTVAVSKKANGFIKFAIVGVCVFAMWFGFFNK